ncbi:MAG: hypothetical protein JSU63_12755 [Phycisphaerales bacterium]|nr:MAG: hypothetical protein JSU63_12755 [Phycisphaerales bacterium]
MKQKTLVVLVSFGAVFVCLLGWLVLPWLQDPQREVNAVAAVHLERARRLLHNYSIGLDHKSMLLDRLAEVDVDVDIEDPEGLVDADPDVYQEAHEEYWEAYEPTDWEAAPPRAKRANYGNLPRQIADGIAARDELIELNTQWLEDALDEVEEALRVSVGDADSRAYTEAKRLKGIILYHSGLTESIRARVMRVEAEPYRQRLRALAASVGELEATRSLATDSGIDEQIRFLRDKSLESEEALNRNRTLVAGLETTIQDLQTRVAAAQARADAARIAIADTRARSADLTDPVEAQEFHAKLMELDAEYRDAERELRSLTVGSFPHARIDHTGDFLHGDYVQSGSSDDLTVELGLRHFENERDTLTAEIRELELAVGNFRSDIDRLEGMRRAYEHVQNQALERRAGVSQLAEEAYAELSRVESEAEAIEESALELFDLAARASAQAAGDAKRWITDASERIRALSPEAKQRSAFGRRTRDEWMEGFIIAQEADSLLAKAWVYHGQYIARKHDATLLTAVSEVLQLKEADAEDEQIASTEARDAGVGEITKAMGRLEQAHRRAEGQWTIVAQQAGAFYLLSLFGYPDYVDEAIEAYRSAVSGREDEAFAEKFVARLDYLENR